LASYLLFEKSYTCELIELGRKDALAHKTEILAFFSTQGTGVAENATV
jgi:NTE family protein